jgi:hypothetical protein
MPLVKFLVPCVRQGMRTLMLKLGGSKFPVPKKD